MTTNERQELTMLAGENFLESYKGYVKRYGFATDIEVDAFWRQALLFAAAFLAARDGNVDEVERLRAEAGQEVKR